MTDMEKDGAPAADSGRTEFKCFVGGLSYQIDNEGLKRAFERYDCSFAEVMMDKHTGRPRGFGFVFFRDERGQKDAIDEMHDKELEGRRISVVRAVPQDQTKPGTPAAQLGAGPGARRDYARRGEYDRYGRGGYDRGYDRGGYDRGGYGGYDRAGYDRGGYDRGYGGGYGGGYDRGYGGGYGGGYERDPYRDPYGRSGYGGGYGGYGGAAAGGYGGGHYDDRSGGYGSYDYGRGAYDDRGAGGPDRRGYSSVRGGAAPYDRAGAPDRRPADPVRR